MSNLFCGTYDNLIEIGEGGFGKVFKALETAPNRDVALKVGKSELAATVIDSMQLEYTLLKSLQHNNIVTVYDFHVTDDGFPVISMEYASGASLRDRMIKNKFRFSESAVRNYAIGALDGLAFLHEKGVLHCDIKPANILLSDKQGVKLCDFGSSKQCVGSSSDGHQTQRLCGTYLYMAPEVLDTRTYTKASDIWALGCTLAELASGKRPWAAATRPDTVPCAIPIIAYRLLSDPTYDPTEAALGHLTESFRDLIRRMLQLDASSRPTATECLQYLGDDSWRTDTSLEPGSTYNLRREAQSSAPHPSPDSEMSRLQDNPSITASVANNSVNTTYFNSEPVAAALPTPAVAGNTDRPRPKRRLPVRAEEEAQRTIPPREPRTGVLPPATTTAAHVWAFQNGRNQVKYDEACQATIETAFQSKQEAVVVETTRLLDDKQASYEINFGLMTQRNRETGYLRRVLRVAEDELLSTSD